MMIRGRLFSVGYKRISNNIFVGKHVKALDKKSLPIGEKCKLHDNVYIDTLSKKSGELHLGNNIVLGRSTRIECTGGLTSIGRGVVISDRTKFGNGTFSVPLAALK